MEKALNEVKTQAKMLLKSIRLSAKTPTNSIIATTYFSQFEVEDIKLKHCLTFVSRQHGFKSWQHAQLILSGKAEIKPGFDMGTLFYPNSAGAFLNDWFTSYKEARESFELTSDSSWLLPYKTQFIVAEDAFVDIFKLSPEIIKSAKIQGRNMVECFNAEIWDHIVHAIISNR